MKKTLFILAAISCFFLGMAFNKPFPENIITEKNVTQVGIIVNDIESAVESWTRFLGLDEAPSIRIASGHPSKPTAYKGALTDATVQLAFFKLDNLTIELIQPDGKPSTWQAFLEEHGPGIHHIAFKVDDMDQAVMNFKDFGINELQHGGWGTGEYAYMDGIDHLALIIELLENYSH